MPYNKIVNGNISNQNGSTSVVEMLSKVQVNRGSLLKSVENLLKTIETSESAVMIPTLLKDKVRVDAWELLFVAKILKASILGHSDLVEFYMNHIGHSSIASLTNNPTNQTIPFSSPSTPTTNAINGLVDSPNIQPPSSPLVRQTHSPAQQSPIGSPRCATMSDHSIGSMSQQTAKLPNSISSSLISTSTPSSVACSSSSSSSSTDTLSTPTNQQPSQSSSCSSRSAPSASLNQRSSTSSWITANEGPAASSISSISTSSISTSNNNDYNNDDQQSTTSGSKETSPEVVQQNQDAFVAASSLLAATRPLLRQAQPPSLLQLTTTNNHINSVTAGCFTNSSIEQLTNQLSAMHAQQQQQINSQSANDGFSLSISTSTTNGPQHINHNTHQPPPPPSSNGIESRLNRSAGCLFRANSGASSPRTPVQTPTTPYPQAETLSNGQLNGLLGDPSAPVKLLLQIEQLKSSISHVTNLIDSVVDLYKKSIDNIAQ